MERVKIYLGDIIIITVEFGTLYLLNSFVNDKFCINLLTYVFVCVFESECFRKIALLASNERSITISRASSSIDSDNQTMHLFQISIDAI